MLELPQVTLLIVDCKELPRAIRSLEWSSKNIKFGQKLLITTQKLIETAQDGKLYSQADEQISLKAVEPITRIQAYSKFMIKELHAYINTPFVLCTQHDAFVLSAKAWREEFLKYDYIGAPWWFNDANNVGNGGFSLRSKRFLEASSKLPLKNYHPEDLILCRTYKHLLTNSGIQWAPENTAAAFSLEGNAKYGPRWSGQFGFHDLEMTDISNWEGYKEFKNEIHI